MRHVVTLTAILLAGACKKDKDPDPTVTDPVETGDTGASVDDDVDGDGFTVADGDCDDGDDGVFPGADEVCDGVDNDCDEATDEEPVDGIRFYTDADHDGYGAGEGIVACQPILDASLDGSDCDDADDTVHPQADELPCTRVSESCGTTPDADHVVPTDFATLQEAIDAAADGAVICVEPGAYGSIDMDHPVELRAYDGPEITSMAPRLGGAVARIVDSPEAVLSGFTLAGASIMGSGAGLYLQDAPDALIQDCVFRDNWGELGGGIYAVSADRLRIEDCRFEANHGSSGGALAISLADDATVARTTFASNVAQDGGAIEARGTQNLRIEDCDFEENVAFDAGAIHLTMGGTITVERSSFRRHVLGGEGGAIFAEGAGGLTLRENAFEENQASHGGAVSVSGVVLLEIADNTFSDNAAGLHGGALHVPDAFDLVTEGNVFCSNSAGQDGGAVYLVDADWPSTDDTFTANEAGGWGGAASVSGGSITLQGTEATGNVAAFAGGGFIVRFANELSMTDALISSNITTTGPGGGLFTLDTNPVTLEDSDFIRNSALDGEGGGVRIDSAIVTVDSCLFEGNVAAGLGGTGGALSLDGSPSTLTDAEIRNNTATYGGGVFMTYVQPGVFVGGEVAGNEATNSGGGLYAAGSFLDLTLSNIHDNTAGSAFTDDLHCDTSTGCYLP